jgi:PAS domain-containing protein
MAIIGILSGDYVLPLGIVAFAVVTLIVVTIAILLLRAERRLRAERQLLDAFMEHIPENVYFKDIESRFVRISLKLARHFGVNDVAQVLGKTDSDFFSSEHASKALADEQEMIRTGPTGSGKRGRRDLGGWPPNVGSHQQSPIRRPEWPNYRLDGNFP